jgi:hypothetical protein
MQTITGGLHVNGTNQNECIIVGSNDINGEIVP